MSDGEGSIDQTDRVDAENVRAQMARILGDPSFVGAPQLSRLLQHLVENALTGERREVKEYSLGVELFDRGVSFDPKIDTVARAAGPRKADPVVIEIPKGHYLAVFRARSTENGTIDKAASRPRRGLNAVAIAIVAAAMLSAVGWWFWRSEPEVATAPSLLVLPTGAYQGSPRDRPLHADVAGRYNKSVKEMAAAAGVDRVLEGSIRRSEDRVRLTVQLIAADDERHMWAENV